MTEECTITLSGVYCALVLVARYVRDHTEAAVSVGQTIGPHGIENENVVPGPSFGVAHSCP